MRIVFTFASSSTVSPHRAPPCASRRGVFASRRRAKRTVAGASTNRRGDVVVLNAAPNASKRSKRRREPDPDKKRRRPLEERLKRKGVDLEQARSPAGAESLANENGANGEEDSEVPATEETCERVAELLFRQDAEGWPMQRTEAWRYARASCVTASDCGKILRAYNADGAEKVLEQKRRIAAEERMARIDLETSDLAKELEPTRERGEIAGTSESRKSKRKGSRGSGTPAAIRHGNEFEAEALAHYEKVHGTKCHEFGLVRHDKYYWLGASPDGVHPAGRVVEIKCPYSRPISKSRAQEHRPQIQILLEVLDLEFCDFVQYKPAGRGKGRSGNPDLPAYNRETIARDRDWFASHFTELESFAKNLPTP